MLAWALRLLSEAAFPAMCIGCSSRGTPLCSTCRGRLPYLPASVCRRCACLRGARGACHGCRQLSPRLSNLRAGFAYEGPARSAVLTLKFRSGRYLAPMMGELLRERLAERPLQADLVVPVPLAPRRLQQRGYNQAQLLAEQVAPAVSATLDTNVLKRHERPAQQTLGAAERLVNLRGSLWCAAPERVHGKRVLIVDDVVTTGATLSACADALADAGAARIAALVFARDL